MSNEAVSTADSAAEPEGGPVLTRKVLMERVQAITTAKPKDVRDVVEATLAVMGNAVKAGEILRLPPFGIGRPRKAKEGASPLSAMMLVKTSLAPAKEKPAKPEKDAKGPDAGMRGQGKGGAGKGGQGKGGNKAKGVETPAASE